VKKKLSILIALVMAISLCLSPVVVSAADAPAIDGVLSEGEWGEPTFVNEGWFNIYVMDDYDYIYVAFESLGGIYHPTGEGDVGMMNLYINNPNTPETWAYCWVHRTPDLLALYHSDPVRHDDPTVAEFVAASTVFELKIPISELSSIRSGAGATITLSFLSYAQEWNDWNNCWLPSLGEPGLEYTLVKRPYVRSLNAFDVFVRWGYDSTRYDYDGALLSSIEADGEYHDTQYMLEIPEGCVVTGVPGRINVLFLQDIDGDVLSFHLAGDAYFSEPCTLYITDGGRLYQDYWTGEWLGDGEWVEVGTFTEIVDGQAHLD